VDLTVERQGILVSSQKVNIKSTLFTGKFFFFQKPDNLLWCRLYDEEKGHRYNFS
jgi:hypothetical protein